jgi:hypothetical protein
MQVQADTSLAPLSNVIVPGGHAAQVVLLLADAKDPDSQRMHNAEPRSLLNVPGSHGEQDTAPRKEVNQPGGQAVQWEDAGLAANVPTLHSRHCDLTC